MMVVMTPRELMIDYLAAARRGDWTTRAPAGIDSAADPAATCCTATPARTASTRDGRRDMIICGGGRDVVRAEARDRLVGCEGMRGG